MTRPRATLFVGLLVTALAVRPQLTAVGPLLPEIQDDLAIDHAIAGLLVAVPVVCMGLFALPAVRLLRRIDVRSAITGCLAAIAATTITRAVSPAYGAVLACTLMFGVASGVIGALLPVVVKHRFADRPALGTGVYALGLNVGATLGAGLAVPLAVAGGGWRWSLGFLAVAGAIAMPAWIQLSRGSLGEALPVEGVYRLPWRSRLAWSLTLLFGFQALCFFALNAWLADALVERGWSEGNAGAVVALLNVMTVPGTLLVLLLGGRQVEFRTYLAIAACGLVVGTTGLAWMSGNATAWGWILVISFSLGSIFPLALTLSVDVAPHVGDAAAIAGMQLGVGYTMAGLSPLVLGALRDATGSFAVGLWLVAAIAVLVLGCAVWSIVLLATDRPRLAAGHEPPSA